MTSIPTQNQGSGNPESETPGRRERKRIALRARILQAARELFLLEGYAQVSVERIAERADVARATFFNHFPSKRSLLSEMASELTQLLRLMLDAELDRDVSTHERLEHFFLLGSDWAEKTRLLTRDLFLEAMQPVEGSLEREQKMAAVHESFLALVRDGQRLGDVDPDEDPAFLAEMVAGAFTSIFLTWLEDEHYPIRQRAQQTARFLARAISPTEEDACPP